MAIRCKEGYVTGDPYVICDICGFKNRMSLTAMMYNNLRACIDPCWDEKPVNDYPPPIYRKEGTALPNSRTEPPDVFIDDTIPSVIGPIVPVIPNPPTVPPNPEE